MAQEVTERDVVTGVATQALKNELDLAVRLLQSIKEARDTIDMEVELVESARGAFRHATDALARIPHVSHEDMAAIHRLMDEFRGALNDLGV